MKAKIILILATALISCKKDELAPINPNECDCYQAKEMRMFGQWYFYENTETIKDSCDLNGDTVYTAETNRYIWICQ